MSSRRLALPLLVLMLLGVAACEERPAPAAPPTAQPAVIPAPPDVTAPPPDALVTPSGLAYKVLKPGTGTRHPGLDAVVEVHYTGWTTDGRMFDSSRVRGEPAVLPLRRVIAGWQEGVQLMVAGEQARFWIPAELAYANASRPDAPQGMLVFDIELIAFREPM